MAFPLTPHTTFVDDSTPSISAAFLNELQAEGINPAAAAAYTALPRLTHYCDDKVTIKIEPTVVMIKDAATSKYTYLSIPYSELTAAEIVPTQATYSASVWYYIYCVSTSSVLSFEISETAPDTTTALIHKTGDETRRYLGCFRSDDTDGVAGYVMSYQCTGGRSVYDENWFVITGAAATSWTALPLASSAELELLLPPHAKHALLRVSNNAAYSVSFRPTGTSYTTSARAVAAYSQDAFLELRCNGSQSIDYVVSSSGGNVDVSVVGWVEG